MKIYQVIEKNGEKQLDPSRGSIIVDAALSSTSKNPVQNKVVKEALDGKQEKGYYSTAKLATGTIDDLWEQVRYTSGCQGSISLQKKESGAGSELPGNTWFNYLYIPHRYGTNEDDNGNYGTIILTRLTTNGSSWIVRCTNGAVADAKYIVNGTEADMNALINKLSEGTSTPEDNDFIITQYVNGGTNTTTYHRRKLSKLWDYIKGKLNTHDVKLANYNIGGTMSFQDLYLRETVTFFTNWNNSSDFPSTYGSGVMIPALDGSLKFFLYVDYFENMYWGNLKIGSGYHRSIKWTKVNGTLYSYLEQ